MADFRRLLEAVGPDQFERLATVLAAVALHGSLNRATAALGVSYRQAWGLLRRAEERLGALLLTRQTGGTAGGGAQLTPTAMDLLARHRAFKDELVQILTSPPPDPARPVLIASTIGPVEAGLLAALEADFHAETHLWVRHIAAGTGQALEFARSGRADLLLTHAPAEEKQFISEGWGERRFPLMTNDFVLCGPVDDPAAARSAGDAPAALRRVSVSGSRFLSRGDRSGTHLKELALWQSVGVEPTGPWYSRFAQGGLGSSATLREADRLEAYTLVDRATFAGVRPERLTILLEGDPLLMNLFSLLSLNPERFPYLNHDGALRFIRWAIGPNGQQTINRSGHFTPCSAPYQVI